MKPFLGIDISENKNNTEMNREPFISATVSEIQEIAFIEASLNAFSYEQKKELPQFLQIIQMICLFVVVIVGGAVFNAGVGEDAVGFGQAYKNAPWLFWMAGICGIIWLVLKIAKKIKNKGVDAEESHYHEANLKAIADNIYRELGVPDNASNVDILSFHYVIKKNSPQAKAKGRAPTVYNNPEHKIFVSDNMLNIADLSYKYSFPLSELRAIRTVNKKITIPAWNKEVHPTKGIYKHFKMNVTNYGCIAFKPYYILEVEHDEELFGIYFPCYEKYLIETLTGLRAEK